MNEIFSNEISELSLVVSVKGAAASPVDTPTAKLYVDSSTNFAGTPIDLTVTAVVGEVGKYSVAIPYQAVQGKRFAKVVYEYELAGFGVITKEEAYEVRARLISFEEYKYMMDDQEIEYWAYNVAETEARLTIENYCQHRFSRWTGSREIIGNSNRFYLPQYLSKLTNVNQVDDVESSSFESTDFILEPTGFVIRRDIGTSKSGLVNMTVTGDWGYAILPDAVRKAAYELTRSFSSTAINDRRQYLLNSGGGGLTDLQASADFMSWKAYDDSTGNAVADQLLEPYRIFVPGVI